MDVSDLGSIDFNQVDCFSSVIGSHQVTYNLNGAGAQCSNDVTSIAVLVVVVVVAVNCVVVSSMTVNELVVTSSSKIHVLCYKDCGTSMYEHPPSILFFNISDFSLPAHA